MTIEEKRAHMLLKSVVFHYHGLDDDEKRNLEETAEELNAVQEMNWANNFVAEDYVTAFERARVYLNEIIGDMPKEKRSHYIKMVWEANNLKGYVTEMEATAIVQFAKDWKVQNELVMLVRSNMMPS